MYVKKQNIVVYIQVVYLLNDNKTIEREFNSLNYIPDNHLKYVLSLDNLPKNNHDGIL